MLQIKQNLMPDNPSSSRRRKQKKNFIALSYENGFHEKKPEARNETKISGIFQVTEERVVKDTCIFELLQKKNLVHSIPFIKLSFT